ncbi:MAG: xylulokinase [Pseudomonadota bacterium]
MFLGLDIGTSGVKALLIGDDQSVVADAYAALEVSRPATGWSEQDPAVWLTAVEATLTSLSTKNDLSGVDGIGLSGQMHGATLLDKADNPLRPCILWNDTRSHAEAATLDANPEFRAKTGNIVFPGFTAPKLLWCQKHEPDVYSRTTKVLLPKDYVRLWLTGHHVSEMSDASGTSWLNTGRRDWDDVLLSATGLGREHMPALVEGCEVSADLRPEIARQFGLRSGIPVAGGAGDNAASAIGVGVVDVGDAFLSLGTSGVLFAASDGYAPDPDTALHTFCHALPRRWHQMGVILAATDAVSWFGRLVGQSAAELTKALGSLRAPEKPLFLPYLGGERTPHNDAHVRGAFIGLEHATDRDAATRAVLEGVAFAFRDCLAAMNATGTDVSKVVAVGGGAASDYWLQAIATTLDVPVAVPIKGDFGAAFGAARLAMMATGQGGVDLVQPPRITHVVEPDRALTAAFDDAHHRYSATYRALKEL